MFTHLHVHTEYSFLDSMCRIPQLLSKAKGLGMGSLAITDHGAMHGAIAFYLQAKEAGIKPIIGCEVYVAEADRHSRNASDKNPYHLILLAKNKEGYLNLIQLVTKAHLEGFYYKPRLDRELLAKHNKGLIALSGCLHGELPRLIISRGIEEAMRSALWHRDVFGDYYLEIQRHPIPELELINQGLLEISRRLGIPIVATNDVHYVNREDASAHELLLCIQSNTSIYDEKRRKMAGDFFYLKSEEEMAAQFSDLLEALENTCSIAEMCHLDLEFGELHLPELELPEGKKADEYLAELCWQGLRERYSEITPEIERRLSYELEVIRKTRFAGYFLVIWDLITFAKKRNILFGVRGSAAASLALYCLGVTAVDPIAHQLVFERFLNVERREMPDIDIDFQDDRREEVNSYLNQKYGADHVAQIITFGTLGARAALRDVGRALGMPYSTVDRIARLIPAGPGMTLDRAIQESKELTSAYFDDEIVRHLVDSAKKLEGIVRHASTHAAGVVITKEPLTQYLPLQLASKGESQAVMTQYAMEDIAQLGLLKMDLLGLANLTVLAKAKEIIAQKRGVLLDLQHLPLDDKKTFDLLSSGETSGVFQLEGGGMRRYLRELKPSTFNDIAAMIALYRPGPMEHLPTFIRAKHGLEPVRYSHSTLTEILKETYGVIVYQEQVLHIVQALAGYSLGEADIFRKAMGKKIPEVMKKEERNFITKAKKKGIPEEVATEVFSLIEPFAGYAFNKAHSVSYALIAYQTAYLKANYPLEYMTAFLITHSGQQDKIRSGINECRRLGIAVLPPDINKSEADFSIESEDEKAPAIRFALASIKNVGLGAIELILLARKHGGPFKSIEDFCRRAYLRGVNKRVLESLIKAGVFDSLNINRGSLLQGIDRILSLAQHEQRLRESGQTTLFDLWGESVPLPLPALDLVDVEVADREKLAWERELLGVYFSEHPFASVAQELSPVTTALCGEIDTERVGETVVIAGIVTSIRWLYTKQKRPFIVAILEDLDGSLEVNVWPEIYGQTKELWQEGNILLVEGKVKMREERVYLSCNWARHYQSAMTQTQKAAEVVSSPNYQLVITVKESQNTERDIVLLRYIKEILQKYPGKDKVRLHIVDNEETVNLELPNLIDGCNEELKQKLGELLGETAIKLEKIRAM